MVGVGLSKYLHCHEAVRKGMLWSNAPEQQLLSTRGLGSSDQTERIQNW